MADKDYSATPLGKKLGAKPGVEVLVLFTTTRAELERRFSLCIDLDAVFCCAGIAHHAPMSVQRFRVGHSP